MYYYENGEGVEALNTHNGLEVRRAIEPEDLPNGQVFCLKRMPTLPSLLHAEAYEYQAYRAGDQLPENSWGLVIIQGETCDDLHIVDCDHDEVATINPFSGDEPELIARGRLYILRVRDQVIAHSTKPAEKAEIMSLFQALATILA